MEPSAARTTCVCKTIKLLKIVFLKRCLAFPMDRSLPIVRAGRIITRKYQKTCMVYGIRKYMLCGFPADYPRHSERLDLLTPHLPVLSIFPCLLTASGQPSSGRWPLIAIQSRSMRKSVPSPSLISWPLWQSWPLLPYDRMSSVRRSTCAFSTQRNPSFDGATRKEGFEEACSIIYIYIIFYL